MTDLATHISIMRERRASLKAEIEKMHEGEKKAVLRAKLKDIDLQLNAINAWQPASPKGEPHYVDVQGARGL